MIIPTFFQKTEIRKKQRLLGVFAFFLITACASYQSKIDKARGLLAEDRASDAVEILAKKAEVEGDDQVVYLLDYGLALHQAEDFQKSADVFLHAQDLAEVKDYTSLSREAGSLLSSERLVQYKSERFENILINVYLALNFLMLDKYEEAQVMCRQIDEKLYKYKMENEVVAKNFLAHYLAAQMWEAQQEWDNAYIEFKNAYEINSGLSYLKEDLIRSAWRARRLDALKGWQQRWPSISLEKIKQDAKNLGEIIFIYQQGWVPRKRARPEDHRFPEMHRVQSRYHQAELMVAEKEPELSQLLYDVGSDAIYTLNEQYKILVAKKIAGTAAKLIIADQIDQKQKGLGTLAYVLMQAADQADLRQWSTLPETFQVSRVKVIPGTHKVQVNALGPYGRVSIWEGELSVAPGKKTFFTHRSF